MKLKLVFFIAILLVIIAAGWAQSVQMRVCKKDGTVQSFNIEDIRKITFAGTNGINDKQLNTIAKNFYLLKSYPNPFNNSATISYTLPSEGAVEITIVDLKGNIIRTLPRENQSPGERTLTWDGNTNTGQKAQIGIYFCKVKFNNEIQICKMLLIK